MKNEKCYKNPFDTLADHEENACATDIGESSNNGTKLKNLFEKLTEITTIVDPNSSTGEDKLGNKSDVQDNQNKNDTDSEVEECGCLEYSGSEPRPKTIGGNAQSERHLLWAELGLHKLAVRGLPWFLMGDFNVVLNMEDIHAGASSLNSAMYDFKDCVAKIEVMDINSAGLHYTWNQKPKGGNGVLKKLDHIMGNLEFMDCFPGAFAIFQPYRIADHSHVVLKFPNLASSMPKPFKFFNFLAYKSKFMEVVACNWNVNMEGHNMFKLRVELDQVQKALDSNPADVNLREEESVYLQAFNEAKIDEERFLKQNAKVD
ncbi:trichome birefringence-like protein 3, partial [Tanacetum coccineum]